MSFTLDPFFISNTDARVAPRTQSNTFANLAVYYKESNSGTIK